MLEEEIIQRLSKENEEFKRLVEEHRELDTIIEELSKKKYLTPNEEIKKTQMKKEKLIKKDKIIHLARVYQNSSN
ncbi:MAG: DUF465 domain-containing protein [Candidatus Magnetoovum sp. WYHC-5]|nr:DUF465 domain-containing protein [Candidatus Magnetoovum sp. WYHC-5]